MLEVRFMKLYEFDYNLPEELIAQKPAEPRDHSRLLVLEKKNGKIKQHTFYEVIEYLKEGDLLVVNNSKVFPARLYGKRKDTGGKVEILLNKNIKDSEWEVIGKNLKIGKEIIFENSKLEAKVIKKNDKISIIKFNIKDKLFFSEIEKIGHTPLPPYIKKNDTKQDKSDYQTVYAKPIGSAAAPTAGLHFTNELLNKITDKGIEIVEVTLHVGLGTFAPVEEDNIEEHKIHTEYYTVMPENMEKIIQAKKEGRRIIAVGTTSTRVLEHLFSEKDNKMTIPPSAGPRQRRWLITNNLCGWTDIFIYPGYKFKCIDGLITNFHLPKSTLLMLVSAFAGKHNIDMAYKEAIKKEYRFFSYGDAMLIL